MISHSNKLSASYLSIDYLYASTVFLAIYGCILLYFIFKDLKIAFLISTIKAAAFFIYFFFFFNESNFNFIDQVTYYENAKNIYLNNINNLTDVFLTDIFVGVFGGHTFYPQFSVISFIIFGLSITSPITLTMVVYYIGVLALDKLLLRFGSEQRFRQLYLAFYLLIPGNIAWSSFFNLRDQLIQTILILIIYLYIKISMDRKHKIILSLAFICLISVMFYLRAHMVLILAAIFFILSIYQIYVRLYNRYLKLFFIFLSTCAGLYLYSSTLFSAILSLYLESLASGGVTNILKAYLSPLFDVSVLYRGYGFMIFNSFFNLVIIPFLLFGFYLVIKTGERSAQIFVFCYLTIFVVISMYDNVQGPRQRLMVDPMLLYLQLFGLVHAHKKFAMERRS